MCTCLIAGRKATASGKAMLAANDDWDGVPGVLAHELRKVHPLGGMHLLVGGRTIPEIPETCGYTYTACCYPIGTRKVGWVGGVNDKGVSVAGTGVCAFKEIPADDAWLEPDDVQILILERAASAREGIRLIGELVAKYGFNFSGLDGCNSMATYAVADSREGWFLEMAQGDHWVAERVPDDEAGVRINAFGTHDVDLTDTENVMASPGLAEFAKANGWWSGDIHHFDFAAAYGADHSPNEWGPELDPMNMRRRWRAVSLLSGKDTPEDEPIYSVHPDHALEPADFMKILRDVYEDTPYDLRKVPAAGRYGNPFHDDPESYSLCRHATVASFVADYSLTDSGIMWTAMACPAMSMYVPLYTDINGLPEYCSEPKPRWDKSSLFWEWRKLGLVLQRRYSLHIASTQSMIRMYEDKAVSELKKEAEELAVLSEEERRVRRTEMTGTRLWLSLSLCRELCCVLLLRY